MILFFFKLVLFSRFDEKVRVWSIDFERVVYINVVFQLSSNIWKLLYLIKFILTSFITKLAAKISASIEILFNLTCWIENWNADTLKQGSSIENSKLLVPAKFTIWASVIGFNHRFNYMKNTCNTKYLSGGRMPINIHVIAIRSIATWRFQLRHNYKLPQIFTLIA